MAIRGLLMAMSLGDVGTRLERHREGNGLACSARATLDRVGDGRLPSHEGLICGEHADR
jgi:hypothetical protein